MAAGKLCGPGAPAPVLLQGFQILLRPPGRCGKVHGPHEADDLVIGNINPGVQGAGEQLPGLSEPLLRLRPAEGLGADGGGAEDGGAAALPALRLVQHRPGGLLGVGPPVLAHGAVHALQQQQEVARVLLQLLAQQGHVPVHLGLLHRLADENVAVVMEHRPVQDGVVPALEIPVLVDPPGEPPPRGPADQAHDGQVAKLPQVRRVVVADHQQPAVPALPGGLLQEADQLGNIPVQPLVTVELQVPGPGAALQHRVPGGGEVVRPGEVEEDIRVPLRYGPAPVCGSGVRHDELTGHRLPQGPEGFQAPLDAAGLVLKNHADGQNRLLFHGGSPFLLLLGKPSRGRLSEKQESGAGLRPPRCVWDVAEC